MKNINNIKNIDKLDVELEEVYKMSETAIKNMPKKLMIKIIIAAINNFPPIDDYDFYNQPLFEKDIFLEAFFENFFKTLEGISYAHDKTVYVISRIRKALKEKRNISLKEECAGKVAYWCPKTIKNTDQALYLYYPRE